MLINDLFKITDLKTDVDKITASISLNANHKIFAAHFPNNPITPGVVQIQIIKEILQEVYKKDLRLVSMPRCNFLKILDPTQTPLLTIVISFTDSLHVSAIGQNEQGTYFKLSATFSDDLKAN